MRCSGAGDNQRLQPSVTRRSTPCALQAWRVQKGQRHCSKRLPERRGARARLLHGSCLRGVLRLPGVFDGHGWSSSPGTDNTGLRGPASGVHRQRPRSRTLKLTELSPICQRTSGRSTVACAPKSHKHVLPHLNHRSDIVAVKHTLVREVSAHRAVKHAN